MAVKVFKDPFDNCYLVDAYEQQSVVIQGKVFYYFDFYPITDLGNDRYSHFLTSSVGSLETIKSAINKERVEPLFSFSLQNPPGTLLFYIDEMAWFGKITGTILYEASEFCCNYWLKNYAETTLPK
jgi:hypothetical protein